jgi:hypothetical protein
MPAQIHAGKDISGAHDVQQIRSHVEGWSLSFLRRLSLLNANAQLF